MRTGKQLVLSEKQLFLYEEHIGFLPMNSCFKWGNSWSFKRKSWAGFGSKSQIVLNEEELSLDNKKNVLDEEHSV